MSSPFSMHDTGSPYGMQATPGLEDGDVTDADIPKRMMRVKVLYTFDDDNKTNCLARLPNALPIPVIALDESSQIGVVELKICIQAIVASSPELIAKLEHDYTVYAYDYSEYETPLVGQGMLSWVLASASPTPVAPASQSKTMITGRVCKNILGLFSSGGIKETLEVKLKLVPVPTRSKSEFLQNMAIYRNPSVVMPDGFDNNAWNSFLQAIPNTGSFSSDVGQMGQGQTSARAGMGGVEQLHDMLTPKFGSEQGSSRPGSPTPSNQSMGNAQAYHQSRPGSRLSVQQVQNEYAIDDQSFEEGPAKKRARLTQADWHGRGSFGAPADSLRVAVSTSASLRGFRPSVAGNSSVGNDTAPRAPTPRPAEKRRGRPRGPSQMSNLRRESSDSSYMGSYSFSGQNIPRTDSGIYSLEEDGGSSRLGSPSPDIPSSPPEYTPVDESNPPSSPGLPELPYVPDSGFQSDFIEQPKPLEKYHAHAPPVNKHQQRQRKGEIEFAHVQPGPEQALPRHSFQHFDPLSQKAAHAAVRAAGLPSSPTIQAAHHRGGRAKSRVSAPPSRQQSTTPFQRDAPSPNYANPLPSTEAPANVSMPFDLVNNSNPWQPAEGSASMPPPATTQSNPSLAAPADIHQPAKLPLPPINSARSAEISQGPMSANVALPKRNPNSKQGQWPKPGQKTKNPLSRSQSWAAGGSSDIDSDSAMGALGELKKSRSRGGSGVVRTKAINTQLEDAVARGEPVKHCRNCGEIRTPTWRPYWVRAEKGHGKDIEVSNKTGVHFVETLTKDEDGEATSYRIYKQYSHLTPKEKEQCVYEQYIFCNPCGDYIRKWSQLRPAECWDPAKKVEKKKRRPRKKAGELTSDAPMPSSEWDIQPSSTLPQFSDIPNFTDPFLPSEGSQITQYQPVQPPANPKPNLKKMEPPPPPQQREETAPSTLDRWDEAIATAALSKAIASSPARILGSQDSPIEVGDELTPRPTRRILFPSPRKDGGFKSLEDSPCLKSKATSPSMTPAEKSSKLAYAEQTTPTPRAPHMEEPDKENLPPPEESDEFAHLFDDTIIPGTPPQVTPNTARSIAAMLKTPTPTKSVRDSHSSRSGGSKRSALGAQLTTPSRSRPVKSPRLGLLQPSPQKPLTPFSAGLNQLLSDGLTSSPSKAFNWALTSSPGKILNGMFGTEDMFSSEFPMPSSPPNLMSGLGSGGLPLGEGLGFEMWEDGTATDPIKGWEEFLEASAEEGMGGSGSGFANNGEAAKKDTQGQAEGSSQVPAVDFAAILEGVGAGAK